MKANDSQHGGTHYMSQTIQPWDYILQNNIGFIEGNIIKYVTRWRDKGGVDDLRKAQRYLQKLIEVSESGDQARLKRRNPPHPHHTCTSQPKK